MDEFDILLKNYLRIKIMSGHWIISQVHDQRE